MVAELEFWNVARVKVPENILVHVSIAKVQVNTTKKHRSVSNVMDQARSIHLMTWMILTISMILTILVDTWLLREFYARGVMAPEIIGQRLMGSVSVAMGKAAFVPRVGNVMLLAHSKRVAIVVVAQAVYV